MESKVLGYGEIYINKNAFHKKKTHSVSIDEVEINKIMLFDKTSCGNKGSFKYYIGYMHRVETFLSPLCIKLTQLIGYAKYSNDNNKYKNFLANDEKLLKNTMKYGISLSKKEFNKKPVHNNKYISFKIKIYNDVMHTEFKYKKILKDNKHCKYIPIAPK